MAEKINLKDKKLLVWDNSGSYVEMAVKLAESFGTVHYFTQWCSTHPKIEDTMHGVGMEGIIRINDFFDHVEDADCILFPDVGNGDLMEYLRLQGKAVFGCGYGQDLEQKRWETNTLFKGLGIPVLKEERIVGIGKLREHLKVNKNLFIKVGCFRGSFETWHHEDYRLSEPHLDELSHSLGSLKNTIEFIVCSALDDAVEAGWDSIIVNGEFPKYCLTGFEIKDKFYCSVFTSFDKLPSFLTNFKDKITPTLKEIGYTGFMSTEERIDKKTKVSYPIDMTNRCGIPPNEIMQELFGNLAEIIYHGAHGTLIEPIPTAKYGVQALISSSWLEDGNWQAVYVPDNIKKWVKLVHCTKQDGVYYIIPPDGYRDDTVGSVVGLGDTLEEAVENMNSYAEEIKGYKLNINCGSIDKAMEIIAEAKKIGIDVF